MTRTKSFFVFLLLASVILYSCNPDDTTEMEEEMATCSDGIQNQDETGVDCGGSCDPCIIGPPTSGYYFYGIIDGVEIDGAGINGVGGEDCGGDNTHLGFAGWYILSQGINGAEVGVIHKFNQLPSTFAGYHVMYAEGSRDYGDCDQDKAGVVLSWLDDNNETWTTLGGSQNGSSFEITYRKPLDSSLITVIEADFNCKLYKVGSTEVKEVTSGKIRTQMPLY